MSQQITRGLVLGKFLPPHKGHEYLISEALQRVDELYIVVDYIADEVIEVSRRMAWMQAICPTATVLTLNHELPQHPEEAPDTFWELWRTGLLAVLPHPINIVFASEEYGEPLAEVLSADFYGVDLARETVPIRASLIRESPCRHWDYLSDAAKSYFTQKICIFGPESVGKSTLTEKLAEHYQSGFVPEYAREVIESVAGRLEYADIETIAQGQHQAVLKALENPGPLLLFDTDALTTKIWSQELFGQYPPLLDTMIAEVDYDLYLLLDVDVPWVADVVRYRPQDRRAFFQKCEQELRRYEKKYVIISGDWDVRFSQALAAINSLLGY